MSDAKIAVDPVPPTAEPAPLQGAKLVIAAIMVAGANLMAALDLTIANVSIPSIAASLGASPREGTWVITSYAVAEAIVVPLTGWLAHRFGTARTLVFAMLGFGIASAMCGLATSLGMIVPFRIIQGLTGGPMIPLSQAILFNIFPKDKTGTAMAIWSMTSVVGPILGFILGGQICDHWGWPWIFLVNVPVAALAAFFSWRLLVPRDPPPEYLPIDRIGLGLMVVWIGAMQIILDRGPDLDWFGSTFITVLVLVVIVSFTAFLIWELTDPNPIVNLRIFRHRGYTIVLAVLALDFGAFLGSNTLIGLWLQLNMGYTPTWAGIAIGPGGLAMFFASPFVAWLSNRVDLRLLTCMGLTGFGLVLFWQSSFASSATYWMVLAGQMGVGFSVAFFFGPSMSLAMGAVKPNEVAAASGLLAFTRTAAIAFATSLTTYFWQNAATRNRVGIVENFDGTQALDQVGAAGLPPEQSLHLLDSMVQSQAVMIATNDSNFIFGIAMIVGAVGIWFVPKARATSLIAPVH